MMTLEAQTTATTSTTPTADRIVLTGFMGAGKSTVGRLLAAELGWEFLDVDALVEQRSGSSIADIFATHGEAVFRRRESAAIARALGTQHAVIALGGGAPEELTNRLLLEQTPGTAVIFLDAPFAVLFDRCVLQEGAAIRPVLQDPAGAADRFRRRTPHYVRSAHHRISTEDSTPRKTAQAILECLR